MAAIHILIFGEMAGFKIVPLIAMHVKMKKKCSWSYEKNVSTNQNLPICMKTTKLSVDDIYENIQNTPNQKNTLVHNSVNLINLEYVIVLQDIQINQAHIFFYMNKYTRHISYFTYRPHMYL